MSDNDFYRLVWATEYCLQMLYAIGDAKDTKDYGLDSDADYNKYLNKLYDLYDIAVTNDVVEQILEELKSDNIDAYEFIEIKEEQEGFKLQEEHIALANSVEVGDYVQLYNGNRRYVCSRDGRSLWVTDKESERTNPYARGWSADLYDIVKILERYES
jgi:hypothetical protein